MRLMVICLVLAAARVAAAQEQDEPAPAPPAADAAEAERPWAVGVSPQRQEEALRLFHLGNDAYAHSEYGEASRLYNEALKSWDHPAIHGNLAVCLIHLDDTVEALAHVDLALVHGKAPLEEHVYDQLLTHRKLLLGQLARIEIESDVSGAEVTLDGQELFEGRGKRSKVVRSGSHQVVARKSGHLTFTSEFTALPTRPVMVKVLLVPLRDAGGYERRWATWKPWSVLGSGAAVALVGLGFQLSAQANIDDYDAEIARSCPAGCDPATLPGAVRGLETRAELQNKIAIGSFIVGGVAITTGVTLLLLNQPRRVRLEESGRRVGAAPMLGPGMLGLSVAGSY